MIATVDTDSGRQVSITCDGCGTKAPPASEILAGHGLNNMGWRCSGGTHLCPSCKPEETSK